jgi:hypothetical protein
MPHIGRGSKISHRWRAAGPGLTKEALLPYFQVMLAKLTSKNQLTLPKRAVEMLGAVTHFQVDVEGDRLVLTPARLGAAGAVRQKLRELGVTEADVTDAVAWARKSR